MLAWVDMQLTHKGRAMAEILINGPGTFRELNDRIADHLGYDRELFWEYDSPAIYLALTDLVEAGNVHLVGDRYELCDHPASS